MPCDVLIDVSVHDAIDIVLGYALARKAPLLVATTGHTPDELGKIKEASQRIPIMLCENLSPGMRFLKRAMLLGTDYFPMAKAKIYDRHHISKVDCPSGTAKQLQALLDAHGFQGEITTKSERIGTYVGTHQISFTAEGEMISICHEVYDRSVYAKEGVKVALWLKNQPVGLYRIEDMEDL